MSSSSSLADAMIRQEKKTLRQEIRSCMRQLPAAEVASQSVQVWERLFELPVYKEASTVGLFLSMPQHEIQTNTALAHALRNGKTVYVPQVGTNFELSDMDLIRVPRTAVGEEEEELFQDWPRNKWNIPEPPQDMPRVAAQPGDLDLLIVPGLCFDAKGGRLGHGKGYYDRFIARIRGDDNDCKKPTLCAVGLEPQFVESIPMTDLDAPMDIILLPHQTIVVGKSM